MQMSADAEYKCPGCKRPLVSRQHKRCQYCGAEIPDGSLYGKSETDSQKRTWETAESKRKKRQRKQDEDEEQTRQQAGNSSGFF